MDIGSLRGGSLVPRVLALLRPAQLALTVLGIVLIGEVVVLQHFTDHQLGPWYVLATLLALCPLFDVSRRNWVTYMIATLILGFGLLSLQDPHSEQELSFGVLVGLGAFLALLANLRLERIFRVLLVAGAGAQVAIATCLTAIPNEGGVRTQTVLILSLVAALWPGLAMTRQAVCIRSTWTFFGLIHLALRLIVWSWGYHSPATSGIFRDEICIVAASLLFVHALITRKEVSWAVQIQTFFTIFLTFLASLGREDLRSMALVAILLGGVATLLPPRLPREDLRARAMAIFEVGGLGGPLTAVMIFALLRVSGDLDVGIYYFWEASLIVWGALVWLHFNASPAWPNESADEPGLVRQKARTVFQICLFVSAAAMLLSKHKLFF